MRTFEVDNRIQRHDRGWTVADFEREIPRMFGAAAKRSDPPPKEWADEYHARGTASTAPAS